MKLHFLLFQLVTLAVSLEHDFKGFDDTILFGIRWPDSREEKVSLQPLPEVDITKNKEVLKVRTIHKEDYDCLIPDLVTNQSNKSEEYDGPNPLQLLQPLFAQKMCSYKLDVYWSYELCHGRFVRQYHVEREGNGKQKSQEFHLGYWSAEKTKTLNEHYELHSKSNSEPQKTIKVDGLALPYVEMVMEGGSVCDLSGKPRLTRILYVCYIHGKHEMYSFKETATCEYEIIILSPLLCTHPKFKPKDVSENLIDCIPRNGAPKKPRSLLMMELDTLRKNNQNLRMSSEVHDVEKNDNVIAVWKVEKIEKDGETHLKFELHPLNDAEKAIDKETAKPEEVPKTSTLEEHHKIVINDDSPVRAFLNGERCLDGGSSYWKFEFCYGQQITQYHEDKPGSKISISLGKFDKEAHLEYLKNNKNKMPKPVDKRTTITHFYSGGDICDTTGKPRQTEVKLRCLENASHSAQVSLYLLEPKTCQYVLGVESPLICEILPLADDFGLVTLPMASKVDDKVVEKINEEESTKKVEVPTND